MPLQNWMNIQSCSGASCESKRTPRDRATDLEATVVRVLEPELSRVRISLVDPDPVLGLEELDTVVLEGRPSVRGEFPEDGHPFSRSFRDPELGRAHAGVHGLDGHAHQRGRPTTFAGDCDVPPVVGNAGGGHHAGIGRHGDDTAVGHGGGRIHHTAVVRVGRRRHVGDLGAASGSEEDGQGGHEGEVTHEAPILSVLAEPETGLPGKFPGV